MLEGLPPHRPTHVLRLITDEPSARAMTELLGEMFDPMETAVAAFEVEETGAWRLEAYFSEEPDAEMIRDLIRPVVGAQADEAAFETIDQQDWVRASLEGLKPVRAGRFLVHGSHDRDQVRANDLAIEIEAALAFGTGHHGTTRGCLLALDWLARQPRRPRHVLDLGTGTGVLAIAAAKTLRVPVLGVDVDVNSVKVARANAALNGAGAFVTAVHGRGFNAPEAVRRAPFDLVLCNILLGPLQRLAAPMARSLMPGAHVVLSGILSSQANAAISAYRSQGLVLERSFRLDGWTTLLLHAPRA